MLFKMNDVRDEALSAEALDFAPRLLAIQESPPARMPRAVMHAVLALCAMLLAWSMLGKLDIVASADGRLVPQSHVKIVQPADAGIVHDILVKEGQTVRAGQVLMRMDTQLAKADERSLQGELARKSLQLRRIDAELAGQPLQRLPDDPDQAFQQVADQLQERSQAQRDALAQQRELLAKTRHELAAASEVQAKLREVTPILKQRADAAAELGGQGAVPQAMVLDRQREYIEKAGDAKAQLATVASLGAAIAQVEQQLLQISSRYRSELHNERVEAQGQHQKLQQEWAKQQHRSGLLDLRAPQAGVVKDLATHTKGAVVAPGTVLLSIVPENDALVAEVMVRNEDVGFVHPQQRVKVKLAAYPFGKYGMLEGRVLQVGPDASDNQAASGREAGKSGAPAPNQSYKALVALGSQVLDAPGGRLRLVPGMQVVAEIHQGRRTVMEYLLSPVRKAWHDSGRER